MGTWWVPCILRACPHCGGCRILCPSRGSLNGMWGGLPAPSCCALRTPWCSLSVEGNHLPRRKTGVWSRRNGQPGPGRTTPHPSVQTDRRTPTPQSRHTDRPPSLSPDRQSSTLSPDRQTHTPQSRQTDRPPPLSPDTQADPHPSVQTDRPTPLSLDRQTDPHPSL